MKPIKITISAFICYANEQVIDFAKLGESGLYLITGQTGAGKTTIFDAISYALYGEASGNSRNKPEKLRSQYVDNKEKTVVDFEFVSGGKRYNIRREIKPQLSRETKEITKLNESVLLTLEDGTMIDREKEVKAKIEDIVGLDKDQFSQIVMIAQNDFLRFLKSDTENRVSILRRIFNTAHIKWFQESLKKAKKDADEALQLIKRDFESRGVNPYERDRVFAEIAEDIQTAKIEQQEIEKLIKELEEGQKKLSAEVAIAETVAKMFNNLAAARDVLIKHNEQKDEIDALQIKKMRGEIALYKVKPIADKCYIAQTENITATKALQEASKDAEHVEMVLKDVNKLLEVFPSVEKTGDEYNLVEKKRVATSERLEKLHVFKKKYDEILSKEALFVKIQSGVESFQTVFNVADKDYKDLYGRFIRNQAGLLAKELKEGNPCLVCGSITHPAPATISDQSINEKELEIRQKAADDAKTELDNKALECASHKSEIKTLKDAFEKDAIKTIEKFDFLIISERLSAEIETLNTDLAALQKESDERKTTLEKLKLDFAAATKKRGDNIVASATALTLVEERKKRLSATNKVLNETVKEFETVLAKNNFIDESDYQLAILTEGRIEEFTKKITEYSENGKQIIRDIKRLEDETTGKQALDIEVMRTKRTKGEEELKTLREQDKEISTKIYGNSKLLTILTESAKELVVAEKKLVAVKGLSDAANGKLDFETYAQIAYFERVLKAANLRLRAMSQNRYALIRKSEEGDKRQRMGLEIDVFDANTGKSRNVDCLSGGESFLASLSLALGLSDVVQQSAGSVHIDAMFIDEGFGSLDMDVLDLSIKTLSDMAGNNRIIGIISHVSELRDRIDKRIDVEKTPIGSKIILSV